MKLRFRFSLRSLLLAVLLVAGAATVWHNRGPWAPAETVEEDGIVYGGQVGGEGRFLFYNISPVPNGRAGIQTVIVERTWSAPGATESKVWRRESGAVDVKISDGGQYIFLDGELHDMGADADRAKKFDGLNAFFSNEWPGSRGDWMYVQLSAEDQIRLRSAPPLWHTFMDDKKVVCVNSLDKSAPLVEIPVQNAISAALFADGKRIAICAGRTISIFIHELPTGRQLGIVSGLPGANPNHVWEDRIFYNSPLACIDTSTGAIVWVRAGEIGSYSYDDRFACCNVPGRECILDARTGETLFDLARLRWLKASPSDMIRIEFLRESSEFVTWFIEPQSHRFIIWKLRRPIEWYGVFWMPEMWLAMALGAGLVWSLWRDRRILSICG